MPAAISTINVLEKDGLEALRYVAPERLQFEAPHGSYLDLRGLSLEPLPEIDEQKLAALCRVVRGLLFAAVDGAKSGHPGGSSSKVEQVLTLLASGVLGFDARHPKHPGRDRVVWSAGHCSPLFHATLALIYETLRREGIRLASEAAGAAVYPELLAKFRTLDGPSGHVESHYALADTSHGFVGSRILGRSGLRGTASLLRTLDQGVRDRRGRRDRRGHELRGSQSRCRRWARSNLVVTLDHNGYGIDGLITEAMPCPCVSHWAAQGWNIIEVDGHNVLELSYAYRLAAQGFENSMPTVVICHTTKGRFYGRLENTAESHGTPLAHNEYVDAMRKLGFGILGKEGEAAADIQTVIEALTDGETDYLMQRLNAAARRIKPEDELVGRMEMALGDRPMLDYTALHPARRTASRPGVQGRRFRPYTQSYGGVVRLGDEAHGVLLRRRWRPDEIDPHGQSRERVRRHHKGQSAGARTALRDRGTKHGNDVVRHVAGHFTWWIPAHDRLRNLWRVHSHDGQRRTHDPDQ